MMAQKSIPEPECDNWLKQANGHFLQSREWAQFQEAVGRQVWRAAGDGWSWLAIERRMRGRYYLEVPCGPTVMGDFAAAAKALRDLGKSLKVDFVRIEPSGRVTAEQLRRAGGRKTKLTNTNPEFPWVLDIRPDEAALRAGLTSGHRNAINAAERRGLSFRQSDREADVETFINFMHATSRRQQFGAQSDDYYRTMLQILAPLGAAKLYLAEAEGQPVAAAIVYDFNGVRYYAHAGADQERNRQLQAAAPLVWQMILDAKAAGYHAFNFWGVTPSDDPHHPWAGFSKFKKAFGGQIEPRLGTWNLPLRPLKYRLLEWAQKV